MKLLTALLFAAVGIVHLVPASGAFGVDAIAKLYGIPVSTPDLEILMRHRAALFGIIGILMIAAAPLHRLQPVALLAGFLSVASFLWIAATVGDFNPAIARVVRVDVAALVGLSVAGACWLHGFRAPSG